MNRRLIVLLPFWPLALPAQWTPDVEGPQRFRLRAGEAYVQFGAEAQAEQRINRGDRQRRDYVFVEPTVGLDLRGSVYHPNLLEFRFQPELGLSWQVMKLEPPGGLRWSEKFLQRYDLRLNVLREKSFATSFFAERARTHRDLDFFSRAQVDGLRYGGHSGYTAGRWPFTVDFLHLGETVTGGSGRTTEVAGDTLSLSASHATSRRHSSSVTYLINTYDRREAGFAPSTGTAQNLNVSDAITWGPDDRVALRSAGLYNRLASSAGGTRSLMLQENLQVTLWPELGADGHYDYGNHHSDNVATRAHEARFALRHQLYRSLSSTFALQGGAQDSHGAGSSLALDQAGAALEESYTKRLPGRSRLSVSASWRGDLQRRRSTGQLLIVANEVVRLSDRQASFLAQPGVVAVGRVTDALGAAYVETLDFVLVASTGLVEIRRVPGGAIPDGGQVLVSYTATAPPNDNYSVVMQYYQVRLDVFNGLLGLYARLNKVDHLGAESLVVRNLADRVVGGEFSWRGLSCGAERDHQASNLSPFYATRRFAALTLDAGPGATVGLDWEQNQTTYLETGRIRKGRSLIGRYQQQLGPFYSQLEGGVRRERGVGFDQERIAVRAAIKYAYGKLELEISYDFEDDDLLGELHRRQHVMLRAKRVF